MNFFDYLDTYRDSLWEESEIEEKEELIRYYKNNREGLPYQSQGLELPEHLGGLQYRNMGTMENHVWNVIARRMKYNHTSWSKRGENHLAKILAKKLYEEILMSSKAPKKDGKGYEYLVMGYVIGLEGRIRGERKKLLAMAGY